MVVESVENTRAKIQSEERTGRKIGDLPLTTERILPLYSNAAAGAGAALMYFCSSFGTHHHPALKQGRGA